VAPWLAVVAVVAAAVLLRQTLPFNVDVSWWLIVSERMLDGQRLYVDILETNPPMALASAFDRPRVRCARLFRGRSSP
jgi:hypothetical protein